MSGGFSGGRGASALRCGVAANNGARLLDSQRYNDEQFFAKQVRLAKLSAIEVGDEIAELGCRVPRSHRPMIERLTRRGR